jgi:hypothetical protein
MFPRTTPSAIDGPVNVSRLSRVVASGKIKIVTPRQADSEAPQGNAEEVTKIIYIDA